MWHDEAGRKAYLASLPMHSLSIEELEDVLNKLEGDLGPLLRRIEIYKAEIKRKKSQK